MPLSNCPHWGSNENQSYLLYHELLSIYLMIKVKIT